MTTLESLQRQMAAAVMQPLTADEDMRPTAPDGRSMADVASSFIAPNSRLTAFERLEIYNRQYWFRILGALAEDFPALRAVLGGRAFDALSIAYLTAHPSRSFSLRNLGSRLVEWLAANPRFTGRRHRLALDVARIEWAFVEAFDSAQREPLTLEQIATLDADSRLALQPHLQLIALEYPADDLVLSLHQRDKRQVGEAGLAGDEVAPQPAKLPRLRRKPAWVAAHRLENSVYYKRLAREEFLVLSAIRAGSALAPALETGFAAALSPKARSAQRVRDMFSNWAELGWVCAPELESLIRP
jgi:hypothetical protein